MKMHESCVICKLPIKNKGKKVIIKGKKGKSLAVCSNCQGDVYLDGIRLNRDIMVVPVKKDSLNMACIQKIYIRPSKSLAQNPKMIAFYLTGDVSAVTHVACVRSIIMNVPKEKIQLSHEKIENTGRRIIPTWKEAEMYNIFYLRDLVELQKHIPRGASKGSVIQNRIYVTFKQFTKAKTTEDFIRKQSFLFAPH